jgi:hypothetical protein
MAYCDTYTSKFLLAGVSQLVGVLAILIVNMVLAKTGESEFEFRKRNFVSLFLGFTTTILKLTTVIRVSITVLELYY